jgi:hypothetical protein
MEKAKKLVMSVGLALMVLGFYTAPVFAQLSPGNSDISGIGLEQGGGPKDLTGVIGVVLSAIKWFYTIIFIVAVVMILYAAFIYITSKGDEKKVGAAKKQLIYAIVGMAVALLSYAIVSVVRSTVASTSAGEIR